MGAYMWRFEELLYLKQSRDKRRYTDKDIAQELGVSHLTVWRWRNVPADNLPLDRVVQIANWLGVGIEELVQIDK